MIQCTGGTIVSATSDERVGAGKVASGIRSLQEGGGGDTGRSGEAVAACRSNERNLWPPFGTKVAHHSGVSIGRGPIFI